MVFYGYELPKKNNEIRLKNVSTSIANANTRKLNNINQQDQTLSLKLDTLTSTSSTQTSLPSSTSTGSNTSPSRIANSPTITSTTSIPTIPVSVNPTVARPGAFDITELKNKIGSTTKGLKKGLTKAEAEFKNKINKVLEEKIAKIRDDKEAVDKLKIVVQKLLDQIIQEGITPREEEIAQEATQETIEEFMKNKQNESEAPTELSGETLSEVEKEVDTIILVKNEEEFSKWFIKNALLFNQNGSDKGFYTRIPFERNASAGVGGTNEFKVKSIRELLLKKNKNNTNIKKEYSQIFEKAYKLFLENELVYPKIIQNRNYKAGAGLIGGSLATGNYYNSHAPNFGNLYITNKSLKKNNLTISRPYSKTQLLSKKNITPLLKKMIFDIANTLEFDKQDYHNLQKDEKIIIEKIIRLQKDMKDVNINKLLEDDDSKIKKRIEILIGEVNAGNVSSLIKKELKDLLKKLYDNKAISYNKYQQSLKSINAI